MYENVVWYTDTLQLRSVQLNKQWEYRFPSSPTLILLVFARKKLTRGWPSQFEHCSNSIVIQILAGGTLSFARQEWIMERRNKQTRRFRWGWILEPLSPFPWEIQRRPSPKFSTSPLFLQGTYSPISSSSLHVDFEWNWKGIVIRAQGYPN